jgi:hypothetical protein
LRRHLYIMGLSNNPTCRKCGTGRKPQSTFCVSVRPWFYSDIHIWVHSFWTLRISGNYIKGPSGTLLKEQGSFNLV